MAKSGNGRQGNNSGEGWGHAGTGGYGGPPPLPPLKGNKKGACDRTGAIAIALTVVGFLLDPFSRA